MILYFKVGNYKSINEPVVLNFNKSSIGEHEKSNVIKHNRADILKSILLYGHNASGKSKILDSLDFFKWMVTNSSTEKFSLRNYDIEPFRLLKSSLEKPSYFEIGFIIGATKFRYGFEADDKKIYKEWLLETKIKKEYPIFLRIGSELEIDSKRFEDADGLEKRMRDNALFLSVASQWNVKKAKLIDDWFESIFHIHGINDKDYRDITLDLIKNSKYSGLVNKFMQKADLSINSVDIVDIPLNFEDVKDNVPDEFKDIFIEKLEKRNPATIVTSHKVYNDEGEFVEFVPFLMDRSESEGTKKYFNLIGVLTKALKEGRLVVIDEFDARLHSLLSKAIVKLFNSEEIHTNAQLLIASHDTTLMDRDILRRDQIYFVEKNKIEATKLTSLAEYKPRTDTRYNRNYLEGNYGGIPFINDLEKLFKNV
jgi:AAA15 family ATPase/GTPase